MRIWGVWWIRSVAQGGEEMDLGPRCCGIVCCACLAMMFVFRCVHIQVVMYVDVDTAPLVTRGAAVQYDIVYRVHEGNHGTKGR